MIKYILKLQFIILSYMFSFMQGCNSDCRRSSSSIDNQNNSQRVENRLVARAKSGNFSLGEYAKHVKITTKR